MTSEEQEALEYFKEVNNLYKQGLKEMKYLDDMASRMDIILNLIEKQQKQIEYLNGYIKVIGRVGGMTSE